MTQISRAERMSHQTGDQWAGKHDGYVSDWRDKCVELRKEVCVLGVQRDEAEGEVKALTAENETLRAACQNFVDKVESGRARSKESYAEMKAALSPQPEGQDNG